MPATRIRRAEDLPSRADRRLSVLAWTYAGFTLTTVPFSLAYGVGAQPGGKPVPDMPLRGTGYTPPLFLSALLVGGARLARFPDRRGVAGSALVSLVSVAILGGSTLNIPTDLRAVRAVGGPETMTYTMASVSGSLALALLGHGVAVLSARIRNLET